MIGQVRCSREKVGGKIRGLPQDRQGAKAKNVAAPAKPTAFAADQPPMY
jgi:hypothetical protein